MMPQSGPLVRIAGVSGACAPPCDAAQGPSSSWVQLHNDDAWLPADLSRLSLRIVRYMDADVAGGSGGARLRLQTELHFGDERRTDPAACAAELPPGGAMTLRRLARCAFRFPPFAAGDVVQLLDDGQAIDEATVGLTPSAGAISRRRRQLLGTSAAPPAYPSASFSQFSLASTTSSLASAVAPPPPPPPVSAAVLVGPRRSAETGVGGMRVADAQAPPPPVAVALTTDDDAAARAAYGAAMSDWTASQTALAAKARALPHCWTHRSRSDPLHRLSHAARGRAGAASVSPHSADCCDGVRLVR